MGQWSRSRQRSRLVETQWQVRYRSIKSLGPLATDGLNLKQGTRGEWFGYGYLPLPLAKAKDKTEGKDIPTGDQCWTLFLNSGNFKGPVTFFLPYFWSKQAARDPRFVGHLLDTRPSNPNRALQMETQHIRAFKRLMPMA